jgi:hypothetical protein
MADKAGMGAPRPKMLRTSSFSDRCRFMPEAKTYKIYRRKKIIIEV